jgi:glycosyltransferase involved in cell wall biosynthesis
MARANLSSNGVDCVQERLNAQSPMSGSDVLTVIGRPAPSRAAVVTDAQTSLPPVRIALLIDRLNCGGAERQFVVLAKALQQHGHSVVAMVFYANGPLEADLRGSGVTIRVLDKRGRWDVVRFAFHLAHVLRQEQPRVLLCYSGVPNILAVMLKPFLPGVKIVWGVRASNMELRRYGWLPRVLSRIASTLSRYADLVIANSLAGLAHAVSSGYPRRKMVWIPNGIDTSRFVPCAESRARLRRQWGVSTHEKLIGLVGRLDPMKDHQTFLKAASMLARERGDVRFVCVGDGPAAYRRELQKVGSQLGLDGRLLWLPNQAHMPDVYNALDVLCSSSSYGEGFPNVLGEAMACGVPCVVTAVGDSEQILGQPEFTVQAGDASALAERLNVLLNSPPDQIAQMAAAGRHRIVREFSIAHLVRATEHALASLLSGSAR